MADSLSKLSSIVSINARTLDAFKFENGEIQAKNLDKALRKDELYVSCIYGSDILPAFVEIGRGVSDEELKDAIELKLYEELGLDTSLEYKIVYQEATSGNTGKNRVFNVFAIDLDLINTQFGKIAQKTGCIDYITVIPFLYSSLYSRGLLSPEGADCFLYFQDDMAHLTIYKTGEYVFYKTLPYSLERINEKFCELTGDRIDERSFRAMLSKEGFNSQNATTQQYLSSLFDEIFRSVGDILNLSKRTYGIENINKMFIGTQAGRVPGINDFARTYFKSFFENSNIEIETSDLHFSIAKNERDWQIDQMQSLMILAARTYMEEENDALNFTIFKRPPPFLKSHSGKLFSLVVGSLFLALLYPMIQFGYGYYNNILYNDKNNKYQSLHVQADAIRAKIAKLESEKKSIQEQLKQEDEKLRFRKKLLEEIHDKKANYPMKSIALHNLTNLLNDKSVRTKNISSLNNDLVISVISKDDKKLTELIKNISNLNAYSVSTKEILLDDNETRAYQSDLEVEIR